MEEFNSSPPMVVVVVVDSKGCLPQNYPGPPKNTSTQKMGYDLILLSCWDSIFLGASSKIFRISKKVWLCVVTSIAVTYMLPTWGLPKPFKRGGKICSFLWREPHEPILSTVKVFRFRQGPILSTYTIVTYMIFNHWCYTISAVATA